MSHSTTVNPVTVSHDRTRPLSKNSGHCLETHTGSHFKAETESLKSINTNLERELNEDTKHLSTLRNTLNEKDNLLRQTKEQIRELSDELESKQSIIRGLQADIEAHEDLSTHDNAHSTEMMPVMLKQPVDSAKLSELDHRIKALLFDNEGLRNKLQHTKNELETARKNMQKQQ